MNFQEYQELASTTAIYPDKGNNLYYPTLGLCGEAGEVAEKIKKVMRDNNGEVSIEKTADLMKEIGDVLWYIAALCEELQVDMETVAILNIKKLQQRQADNKLKGSGDNR